jgi:tetratricopeptide (TPR) repeat protein
MGFDKTKAVRAAEKYLAQGKIPAATQEYRRIVEHDPEDFSALNTLGDLYSRVDKRQEAVACFKRVAEHYREQGFRLKAIAVYKKITRFLPGDVAVATNLAKLYEQQGLLAEARTQYLTVAEAQARAGNTRESLEVLRRVADLDPNNIDIRLRLADGLMRDNLAEEAADAYTEAGERLCARGDYERALEAYTNALSLRPQGHAALQGLVTAHTALGTADEAAEVLEQAAAVKPGDLELRAMLVRAYVEAENAAQAERAADELISRDPKNYAVVFDVVRLYLQQNETTRAVGLLERVVEPALSGRNEPALVELLQEALARDPEEMNALQLLGRVYTWQRDDERLRTVLERLADAAEASGNEEVERGALAQLVRLAPHEPRYAERLQARGGTLPGQETGAARSDEVPTFESFLLTDDAHVQTPTPTTPVDDLSAADPSALDMGWQSVPESSDAQIADSSSSFADLNEGFADASAAPAEPEASGFQEVDFGTTFDTTQADALPGDLSFDSDARLDAMLTQELESVDFYISQGYHDVARDTLDMLTRQYGEHAAIAERRAQLSSSEEAAAATTEEAVNVAPESFEFANDFGAYESGSAYSSAPPAEEATDTAAVDFDTAFATPAPPAAAPAAPPVSAPSASTPDAAGLDPGLAAIFDEFREAVEDVEPASEADYETHYNLGLAYKDMDLLDQAIEAFQTAITVTSPGDGTPRYLQCCNMLGHCFTQKGMPQVAAMWFRKGLEAPGHTEDEYQALRYDLGTAYEQMGDIPRALDTFMEVYGINVSYRGVSDKLRELQALKSK